MTARLRRRSEGMLVGLSARVQLGVGELSATLLPGARSPLTGMGRALIDLTPGPLVDATVALVEGKDKPLLMANLLTNYLGVGAAAGALSGDWRRTAPAYSSATAWSPPPRCPAVSASRPPVSPQIQTVPGVPSGSVTR